MPSLIPASRKPKLPSFLSYPVGFEVLALELADTVIMDVAIHFASIRAAVFDIRHRPSHPVLEVAYGNRPRDLSANAFRDQIGYYRQGTELLVYPVAREHRLRIRELLTTEGFSRVRRWLGTPRSQTWLQSNHNLTVTFIPALSRMDFDEGGSA